jgi:hypothetical protein
VRQSKLAGITQFIDPESVNRIGAVETIDRKMDVLIKAAKGTAYAGTANAALMAKLRARSSYQPERGRAFGDCSGPV